MGNIKEVLRDKNKQTRNEKYNKYVKDITPVNPMWINLVWAFVFGGGICVIAQFIKNTYIKMGSSEENASLYLILTLIIFSVITTGLGWYSKFAKIAGAGAVVPITGFANSVASATIEYQKEGQVFGLGCKIFCIAGPVIVYGIVSSWVLGVGYWILKMMGIV